MRKLVGLFAAFALMISLTTTGCAGVMSPISGLYMKVNGPMQVAGAMNGLNSSKVGEATATSILGIVATGDCSIQKAAENGGITKISHVDTKVTNILGFYAEFTTVVYGE